MTPEQFISKWKSAELNERAAAQSHFIDLCTLLDEDAPTDADPKGEWYAFERGATKTTGGEGWADVWKRNCFGWEYKGKKKSLNAAFAQLQQYALALDNPPLLVVCDLDRFRIHTNWTNSVSEVHEFSLEDLREFNVRQKLKWVFSDPERLKPGKTRQALTEEAAAEFAKLAQRLRDRGNDAEAVAHFINRLVFCMFAEDVDLLPNKMFKRLLEHAATCPEDFQSLACDLFKAMKSGGRVGFEHVAWFNGGLFNSDSSLALDKDDIALTLAAAKLDWAEIDPSILGTLFERGLDPSKRSQLGAHYTDREKIMLIIGPVITRPWLDMWEAEKKCLASQLESASDDLKDVLSEGASYPELIDEVSEIRRRRFGGAQMELFPDEPKQRRRRDVSGVQKRIKAADDAVTQSIKRANQQFSDFITRLRAFRVLDPACGSGNFLYLALLALKDLEHLISIEAEILGLHREFPQIGPGSVKGIEINGYAAELARVSVWIGEIQWMIRNGFGASRDPILKPLESIECRDAIVASNGTEADWPSADVVIGNPPFLGSKEMRGAFSQDTLSALRSAYLGKVPGRCDLVMYWFYRVGRLLQNGSLKAAGLVATNKIRKGENALLLDTVRETSRVSHAWSDLPWVVDGAAVRISIVCLDRDNFMGDRNQLDGRPVAHIRSELVSDDRDSAVRIQPLAENRGVAFVGGQKDGPFDIPRELAIEMIAEPLNPNGRSNADVIRPWCNGMDLARRPSDTWIIDFGEMSLEEAKLYQAPFKHVEVNVAPRRKINNDRHRKIFWWQHGRPASRAKNALGDADWMIATPLTSKHRWFISLPAKKFPDNSVVVVVRNSLAMLGVLSSSYHIAWATSCGNFIGAGNDPRYTPSTTFDTFPFPEGMEPAHHQNIQSIDDKFEAIALAARNLEKLRKRWLNPSDLVRFETEAIDGLSERYVPVNEEAKVKLKQRTLTKLYNEYPAWLASAHTDLDAAVAKAYGWPSDITEDEAIRRLFVLNQIKAVAQRRAPFISANDDRPNTNSGSGRDALQGQGGERPSDG